MNLNQITLPVLNVQKAIAFYESLGLILIVKSLPHYARFLVPDGMATLLYTVQTPCLREMGFGFILKKSTLMKR
jgi:catechol 2,3-dioxygenase-like lactoylglutathione lyase family enzyme